MIKIDIVRKIGQHLKLKDAEALAVVDAIVESLKETINEEGRLEVRDFGVFQIKERKPRLGRNPRNLQQYQIPMRRAVTFKLGKELKDFAAQQSGPSQILVAGAAQETAPTAPSQGAPGPPVGDGE